MGQKNRKFVVGEWVLDWPVEFIPFFDGLSTLWWRRSEFVPAVSACSAWGANRACEHVDEEKASRNLPTSEVSRTGGTPVV
jgi:hypothetical protein